MTEAPTHRSVLKGMAARFGLVTLGSGAVSITGFLVAILVVKSYTKEDTGYFATSMSLFAMALALTDLGMRRGVTLETATRLRSAKETVGQVIGTAILFRTLLLIAVTVVGALVLYFVFGGDPLRAGSGPTTLYDGFAIVVWMLAPVGIIVTCIAVAEGFQCMGQGLICSASQQVARLAGALVAAVAALSLLALFRWWAVLFPLATVFSLLIIYRLTSRRGVRWALSMRTLAGLWRRSFPLYLGGLCDRLASPMLIGLSYVAGDAETAAVFFVLRAIGGIVIEIAGPFGNVLLPVVPNINDARESKAYLDAVGSALRLLILGSAGYLLFLTVGGPVVLDLLSSDQASYRPYLLPLLLVAFGSFVDCQRGVWDVLLIGAGKTTWYAAGEWTRLVAVTVLGVVALNVWGVTGLAGAYFVCAAVLWAAKVFTVSRAIRLRVWPTTTATIAVIIACAAAAALIHELR